QQSRRPASVELEGEPTAQGRRCLSDHRRRIAPTWGAGRVRTLVLLAGKIDWDWIDGEIAPLYSENGRPGIATRFMIGLLLLKHIYGLSDEGVCERWVHDPYFQFFTGEYLASARQTKHQKEGAVELF